MEGVFPIYCADIEINIASRPLTRGSIQLTVYIVLPHLGLQKALICSALSAAILIQKPFQL